MSWSPEQLAFARAWSAALLAFGKQAFVRGTISDVVAWNAAEPPGLKSYTDLRVAFVGDGLKVSRAFGYFSAEGGENLDMGAMPGPISYAAKSLLKAPEMARDVGRDKVGLSDLLQRLEGQGVYEFCAAHGIELPFTETSMRLIIEPGYPWPRGDAPGLVYWSAKKGRLIEPERPAWLIEVMDRDDMHAIGVNPCAVFPPEPQKRAWPLWARAGKQDLIVAHSMTLLATPDAPAFPFLGSKFHKHTDAAIESIKTCGGLLFPSLSVGAIPASNFGPITLVGHLGLVLDGLKPFRERGERTSWVYAHDAWTVSTGELMRDVAIRLFDELHGHEDYVYGYHIWSIGPPSELFGGPSEGSSPLNTVKELTTAMARRSRSFKRHFSREEFELVNDGVAGTVDKYIYCESKARRVISLDEFPFMVGPDTLADQMAAFAKGVGYRGKIVLVPDSIGVVEHENTDEREYVMFQWSWLVADAIKKLGEPLEI